MSTFAHRLQQLRADIITQGDRVVELTLRAVESFFDRDIESARQVIEDDEIIDRADIEIERASVPLLAMGETDEHNIRWVLAIVKINNELERIGNRAKNIAEVTPEYATMDETVPNTFRVMANSVIGIMRDTNRVLAAQDLDLAERVLNLEDTVARFGREIGEAAERRVASGADSIQFAMRLRTVTKSLERINDHCCNICEQIIYLETGNIVRHLPEGWSRPAPPKV